MFNNRVNDKYLNKYNKLDLESFFDSNTKIAIGRILDDLNNKVKTINGNFLSSYLSNKPVISLEVDEFSHEFSLKKGIFIRESKPVDNIIILKLIELKEFKNVNFTDTIGIDFLRSQVLLFYCIHKITDQNFKTKELEEAVSQHIFNNSMSMIVKEFLENN